MSTQQEVYPSEADDRLDELRERVAFDIVESKPRIQRHLDRLRQQETLVRGNLQNGDGRWQPLVDFGLTLDFAFRLIEIELDIAAAAIAGDLADDAASFAAAVAGELAAWDLYLERLQVRAAYLPDRPREAAEEALRGLRHNRHALARLLAAAESAPSGWRAVRDELGAVRRELERAVDGISI